MKILRRDKSGAVAVEFVGAVMPLFFVFFGFWQVGAVFTANLAVKHAANVVVRAASVIKDSGGSTNAKGDGTHRPSAIPGNDNNMEYLLAGNEAIAPWFTSLTSVGVPIMTVTKAEITYDPADPYGPVHVHVEAYYICTVPMGKRMACGGGVSGIVGSLTGVYFRTLKADAELSHQGAKYKT